MLHSRRAASQARGLRLVPLHSSDCHCFWIHGERWGVKGAFGTSSPFTRPFNSKCEPTLTMAVITSARSNGGQYCIQPCPPVPRQDLPAVLSVRFSCGIISQGLESHQSEIVKRLRSTPRLPTVQRGNGAKPSTPLGVVMGMADSPGRWQPFRPTGGTDRSW